MADEKKYLYVYYEGQDTVNALEAPKEDIDLPVEVLSQIINKMKS